MNMLDTTARVSLFSALLICGIQPLRATDGDTALRRAAPDGGGDRFAFSIRLEASGHSPFSEVSFASSNGVFRIVTRAGWLLEKTISIRDLDRTLIRHAMTRNRGCWLGDREVCLTDSLVGGAIEPGLTRAGGEILEVRYAGDFGTGYCRVSGWQEGEEQDQSVATPPSLAAWNVIALVNSILRTYGVDILHDHHTQCLLLMKDAALSDGVMTPEEASNLLKRICEISDYRFVAPEGVIAGRVFGLLTGRQFCSAVLTTEEAGAVIDFCGSAVRLQAAMRPGVDERKQKLVRLAYDRTWKALEEGLLRRTVVSTQSDRHVESTNVVKRVRAGAP